MKIGIFTECFEPVITGVVHSIDSTKKGVEELGHEVYLFAPNYGKKNLKIDRLYPCPNIPLGSTGYTWVYDFPNKYKDIAKDMDVIHTHHPFTMASYAHKIARTNNRPLLFTNHTQYDQYIKYVPIFKGLARKSLNWYLRKFCNKCDLIIAPSHGIKKIIVDVYKTKTPVEVVPNGIEIEKFQRKDLPRPKEISAFDEKTTIALFVGRVCYEKNIDYVIKAFPRVVEKFPDVRLVIVGGGPAFDEFGKLAKNLGIEKNVIMTGPIPYEDIMKYYSHADFFVSASKTEVHPLVGIEAIASGLPIVALSAVGYDDIVRNGYNGYLSRENQEEYVSKIVHLLNNPALVKEMSENALKEADKYSIQTAAKNMLAAYERAISLIKRPAES